MKHSSLPLPAVLSGWAPGSRPQPWTWGEEEREILARECMCCGRPGHYQRQLEAHLSDHGLTEGVCLTDEGLVWDGHHRIVAARRLGIQSIPLESREQADERWLRDHGPVTWECRTFGDIPAAWQPIARGRAG